MARRNAIILFVACVFIGQAVASTRVEIFYETHCPDSQHIMRNGLGKSLDMLGHVDFVLVPYGKASTYGEGSSQLTFSCQHGEKECEGNRYHACAIDMYKDKKMEILKFAICTMSFRQNVLGKIEECAKENGFDYSALRECATGQKGNELLAAMGVLTRAAAKKITGGSERLNFVPSTIIDQNTDALYPAYDDLRKAICQFAKEKPKQC